MKLILRDDLALAAMYAVIAWLDRATQYATASRLNDLCLWISRMRGG